MTDEPQHGQEVDDLWAWIDQEDQAPDVPDIPPSDVTAVMVVHDAAEWLPKQITALAQLEPRPGRILAVDTGSSDGSAQLLAAAQTEGVVDSVMVLGPEISFGQAVAQALDGVEPAWIWLLHDDSLPHPNALGHLLEGARLTDVVVPKLLEPKRRNYPETLAEVGQAITPGGLRVPLVEVGDIDQQQTESRDVLGASTAGLLIRGETWRELGGIAPEVSRHRDGLDFGWRTNAVGYRVLTWPAASLNHLQAGRTGQRPSREHPHVSDRLAALRIAGSRGTSGLSLAAGSVLRALGFLLAKSPSHARAELRAWNQYRSTAEQTRALAARLPAEDLTPEDLLPTRFWPLRHAFDRVGAGITERYHSITDVQSDTSIDELTSDDYTPPTFRRRLLSPTTLLVVVLLVAAVVASRTLLGSGAVSGGGMLPAPGTLGEAWQGYVQGNAPWLGLAAVGSLAGLGSPGWFSLLAIVLTPLLAAISAFALLRKVGIDVAWACAASAAWAGGTILLGLVTAGDITGMVLAVTGPLLVRAGYTVVVNQESGTERLRAPAVAGFWVLVAASVWPIALIGLTVVAVVWVLRNRARLLEAAIVVIPAWVFLLPWMLTLGRDPGRLLTGVDPLAWPDYPPASYALVVGRILPSGLPLWTNIAFFAILGVAAVVGLARLRGRTWIFAVVALAAPLLLGTVLSRITVTVDGGTARPLLSPWALLVLAALLLPILWKRPQAGKGRVLALIALALSGALAAGVWAVVGFAGPVKAHTSVLPGYVRDVISSTRDSRALVIQASPDSGVTWNVVDARQPQWGTGERNPVGSFAPQFTTLVYSIAAADPPVDLAARLQLMGVSHVYVGGVDTDQRVALDNLEGMVSNPADDNSVVWTVSGLVSRLSVAGAEDPFIPEGRVPEGSEGQMIHVAEDEQNAWTVKVDGRPLPRAAAADESLISDSVQAFGPIETTGATIEASPVEHAWHAWLQGLVLLALALFAAPTLGGSASARRGQ